MISFSFVVLLALGLVSLFVLGNYKLVAIFVVSSILSLFAPAKALGLIAFLGGVLLVILFFMFGFVMPYFELFTVIALTVAGGVLFFVP